MQYEWIAGSFVVLCIIFLVVGITTLARKNWFIAWLRGSLGIICLLLALFLGLMSINIFSYKNLISESPVATISFEQNKAKEYLANVAYPSGDERSYRLTGDLWQADAKMIKWSGIFSAVGFKPGYKLDRIQGRYIALEDERSLERTVYQLSDPDVVFDMWESVQSNPWIPGIDAVYGSATYLPMADGAIFSISLSFSGLIARPMNERAEVAVNEWQ